jgi:hypothetical protein
LPPGEREATEPSSSSSVFGMWSMGLTIPSSADPPHKPTVGATNSWDLLDVVGTLALTGLPNAGSTINTFGLHHTRADGE